MIRFTITSGKLVLDPNIVLFKDLQDLFSADGPKFLQVIYYTILQSQTTLSLGWMLEYWKRISCGRCLTKALGRSSKFLRQLKINSNWLQTFSDVQQYS
jgi:hypothetical protein